MCQTDVDFILIQVGLGTDVAGGFSPSILNTMRMAVMASNTLTFSQGRSGFAPLGFSDALYLATRGGAGLLDMEDDLGALEPGMQADMILVDMDGEIIGDDTNFLLPLKIITVKSL